MKLRDKIALGSFAGLFVFLVGVAWLIDYSGQKKLEAAVQAIIDAGGIRDFSSFEALQVPDDENAALAWIAVFDAIREFDLHPETLANEQLIGAWSENRLHKVERLAAALRAQLGETARITRGQDVSGLSVLESVTGPVLDFEVEASETRGTEPRVGLTYRTHGIAWSPSVAIDLLVPPGKDGAADLVYEYSFYDN